MSATPPDKSEEIPDFDKRKIYDEKVKPIVQALHETCLKHELPLFAVVEVTKITKREPGRTLIQRDMIDVGATGPNAYVPAEFIIARLVCREESLFRRIKLMLQIARII